MPLDVTAGLTVRLKTQETLTLGIEIGQVPGDLNLALTFANGTGANAINQRWTKTRTATAAPDTWTLSAITDDLGRSIPFAKVRLVIIQNLGVADLKVGNAASHPWAAPFGSTTSMLRVPAGGFIIIAAPTAAGLAVGSGTSDQIMIDPGAATVDYQMVFLGE